jgi:hypothetical protein
MLGGAAQSSSSAQLRSQVFEFHARAREALYGRDPCGGCAADALTPNPLRQSTMKTTTTIRLLIAAALGLPAAAPAQQAYALAELTVDGAAPATADRLDQAAVRLYGTPSQYREAARLHQRSAALRPTGDPRAVQSLIMAGRLLYARGDLSSAGAVTQQAAARALARGDVVAAANAELDAGIIAQEQGKSAEAQRLGGMAQVLATSPLLSEAQRASILTRIIDKRQEVATPSAQ